MIRLKTISIESFRSVDKAEIDLSCPTIIAGFNGAGKSTVICAVQWVLFGFCEKTGGSGQGAKSMIRTKSEGTSTIRLAVGLSEPILNEDGDEIWQLTMEATIHSGKKANEWICYETVSGAIFEAVASRDDFWSVVGVDKRTAQVAAMPEATIEDSDFSGVLGEYLSTNLSREKIMAALDTTYVPALEKFAKGQHNALKLPADWQNIAKALYTERTNTKRAYKEHESELIALGRPRLPKSKNGTEIKIEDRGKVEAILHKTEDALRKLYEERGRSEVIAKNETLDDKVREHNEKKLEKAVNELQRLKSAWEKATEDIKEGGVAIQDTLTAFRECQITLGKLEGQYKALETRRDTLIEMSKAGNCPTCMQKLTKAAAGQISGPIESEIKELSSDIGDQKRLTKTAEVAYELASKAKDTAQTIRDQAQNDMQPHHKAKGEAEGVLVSSKRLEQATEADVRPVTEVEVDIEALEERKANALKALDELKAFDWYAKKGEVVSKMAEYITALDYLVQALYNGDVIRPLLQVAIDRFAERVSALIEPFGFKIKIKVDKRKATTSVSIGGEAPISYVQLSDGERAIVRLGIGLAFGTDSPILVDNLNELDSPIRTRLFAYLKKRQVTDGGYSGVFCVAWQAKEIKLETIAKALAPMRIYWADNDESTTYEKGK